MFNKAINFRASGAPNISYPTENEPGNGAALLHRYAIADDGCVEFLLRKDGDLSAVLKYSDDSSVTLDIRCSPEHLHAIRTGDREFAAQYFSGAYIKVAKNDHGLPIAVSICHRGEGGGGKLADLPLDQRQGLERALDQIETELNFVSIHIAQEKNDVIGNLLSVEARLNNIEEFIPGDPLLFQALVNFHRCYADYLSTFELEDRGAQHQRIAVRVENKLKNAKQEEAWRIPSMAPPLPSASSEFELDSGPSAKRQKMDVDLLSNLWPSNEDIYQTVAEHTVFIRTVNGGEGSGCLFQDHDGQTKLLTAAHVMNAQNQHDADQAYCAGRSLMICAGSDIASHDASIRTVVDRSFARMQGLPLGDPGKVQRGDTVYLCGMPFQSTSPHVHEGKISLIERDPSGKFHMKIDGTAVPGMSGGPIVAIQDGQAVLIGMIASESFDPKDGFGHAVAELERHLRAIEALQTTQVKQQEAIWTAIKSNPAFTTIPPGSLYLADLHSIHGYSQEHFALIRDRLSEARLLNVDNTVNFSQLSLAAVRNAMRDLELPAAPVTKLLEHLSTLSADKPWEQPGIGDHFWPFGYVHPGYARSLWQQLRQDGLLNQYGCPTDRVTEDEVRVSLKNLAAQLVFDRLKATDFSGKTAESSTEDESTYAGDPLAAAANVVLSLKNSLSTNIVKGYFVADILDVQSRTLVFPGGYRAEPQSSFGISDSSEFSILRGPRYYETGHRPPKIAGNTTPPMTIGTKTFTRCSYHHIIPQTYMQFLFDRGYAQGNLREIFKRLVRHSGPSDLEKDDWVDAPFNFFHGPVGSERTNDPGELRETVRPLSFPQDRWARLTEVAKKIKEWLENTTTYDTQKQQLEQRMQTLNRVNADASRAEFEKQWLNQEKAVITECMRVLSDITSLDAHSNPDDWGLSHEGKAFLKT